MSQADILKKRQIWNGFALPTVLIGSVVMLSVLAVAVSATASIRTSLKTQYYSQLAQAAGDAGIAYAKACLQANGNVPTWSDANPLTPRTNCAGTVVGGYPNSVSSNGDIVSSFSVGLPTTDADGRAVTIPNSGYVQLLRSSTGEVWKTYTQPTAQPAVVPDLCSGSATSTLGWSNAVVTTTGVTADAFDNVAAVSLTSGNSLNPGLMYYRKDFSVTSAGTYDITADAGATFSIFVDEELIISPTTAVTTQSVSLSTGCHTILARVVNGGTTPNGSELRVGVKKQNSSNFVAQTDSSWRTSAGNTVSYSQNDFYSDSWVPPRIVGWYNSSPWTSGPTNWYAITGDYNARWLGTMNYAAGSYPATSWAYFRTSSSSPLTVTSPTEFKISVACDDLCNVYIDGNQIISAASWSTVFTNTITLSEGAHSIGVELYNNGAGASGFILSAMRTSDSKVVLDSNSTGWVSSNSWHASQQNFYSYSNTYQPNPSLPKGSVNTLVVGGGGGGGSRHGGGGGAGGLVYETGVVVTPGQYSVVVGAGGTGTTSGASTYNDVSSDGENSSVFGLVAFGGGGGKGSYPGALGGSGGGGGPSSYAGGPGMGTQGYAGGSGLYSTYYIGGGGGGAGGAGQNAAYPSNTQPPGGVGLSNSITGSAVTYAAGGRGGSYNLNTVGAAGAANTGNGGGGAGGETNGGGAGGSGVVIISYPTGSMTATGGTITASGGNTIHTFNSSGAFTITSIN